MNPAAANLELTFLDEPQQASRMVVVHVGADQVVDFPDPPTEEKACHRRGVLGVAAVDQDVRRPP